MPTARTYTVHLSPATLTDGGFSYLLCDPNEKRFQVTATSLNDLEQQVRDLGKQFGQHAACYVGLPRGERKPAGFDKLASRLQFLRAEVA